MKDITLEEAHTRIRRLEANPPVGGSTTFPLWETFAAATFGGNVSDTGTESVDWLNWVNDGGITYDGSATLMDVDPLDSNRWIWMPKEPVSVWWKVEFALQVPADWQTEPIATRKRWSVKAHENSGNIGSWLSANGTTIDPNANSIAHQHNMPFTAPSPDIPSAEVGGYAVAWMSFLILGTGFSTPLFGLGFRVRQTHPSGVSAGDRQTNIYATCLISQVREPGFPPEYF